MSSFLFCMYFVHIYWPTKRCFFSNFQLSNKVLHGSDVHHNTNELCELHRKRGIIAEANRKLTFVPLIFLLCRVWGTVRFIMDAHFPETVENGNTDWIIPLQVGTDIIIFNAIHVRIYTIHVVSWYTYTFSVYF